MDRERFIEQFSNLQKKVDLQRNNVEMIEGDVPEGFANVNPYAHLKDPSLARAEVNGEEIPIKGPDGYIRGNYTGDPFQQGRGSRWVRGISKTVGGPIALLDIPKGDNDNFGVRVDELRGPRSWLSKVETVFQKKKGAEVPDELAYITTEIQGHNGPARLGETQIEIAVAVNPQGTHFEGRGVILQAENGEIIYDPSPFLNEKGEKCLLFVSKRGDYGEICVVTSANNTWDGKEWINRRVLVRPEDVPSQHDRNKHGEGDFEFNLENPRMTLVPHGRNRYAVLSCTAFYPPPVQRSFRQHGVILVAPTTEGPFKYAGVATTHTQAGFEDFRSGEAGGLSQFYPDGNNLIAFQHSKAYGSTDAEMRPDGKMHYPFQKEYMHPSWTIEKLTVSKQALGLWAEAIMYSVDSASKD